MIFKFSFLSRDVSRLALYGEDSKANIKLHLHQRESGLLPNRHLSRDLGHLLAKRLPAALNENQFVLDGYDKVFSSAWITSNDVVLGTKCNNLLLLNVDSGRVIQMPMTPVDLHKLANNLHGVTKNNKTAQCAGIHALAVNPSGTLLAVGTGKPLEVVVYSLPSMEPVAVCSGHTDLVFSLDFLTDDLLVTGSRDSCMGVFSLKTGENITTHIGSLPLPTLPSFSLDSPSYTTNLSVHAPLGIRREHKSKVRALKYNPEHRQITTLGSDGLIKLWDANRLDVLATTELQYPTETVCIDLERNANIYAVGSQAHISIYDPRVRNIVDSFASMDDGWGVRSLAFNNQVLACGGGLGRVSFYDLRASAYIDVPISSSLNPRTTSSNSHASVNTANANNTNAMLPSVTLRLNTIVSQSPLPLSRCRQTSVPSDSVLQNYRDVGQGWLAHDMVYMNHFQGHDIRHAIYTLKYDATSSRLFAGGGPLQLGLTGSYASIW